MLRKSKKENYFKPKSYRSIALLSTLKKALKTVITRRLSDCAEDNGLLPPKQMRARRKRSTKTALETIVDTVHTVWDYKKNKVASLLLLDITKTFDNVSYHRLLHNLRQKKISKLIVNWTRSFLTDRETSLTLKRITSRLKSTETGIPQRSPISPILFLFFNAPLIKRYAKTKLKLQVEEFVDDIYLLTYEKSTKINYETLKKIYEIYLQWAGTYKATFTSKKYELIHLTRSLEKFNIRISVNLDSTTTKSKTNIRVLGLQIDDKLRWRPYIREVKAKMKSQCRALSIIITSV